MFLIFFIAIFFACDNEIDINEEWRDIPVIYAIFDSGSKIDGDGANFGNIVAPEQMWDGTTVFDSDGEEDDQNNIHFVRVQKSFLGPLSANNYIGIADSIYYDSDKLDVWVERVDVSTGQTVDEHPLELATASDLEFLKDDGNFHSSSHYLFKLPAEISDLCAGDCDNMPVKYRISVFNNATGETASAETNIVEPIDFNSITSGEQGQGVGFWVTNNYSPANTIISLIGTNTITFMTYPKNAKIYSAFLRFHYLEQSYDGWLEDKDRLEAVLGNDKLFYPVTDVERKYVDVTLQSEWLIDGNTLPYLEIEDLASSIEQQIANSPNPGKVYRYPLYSFLQDKSTELPQSISPPGGLYHRCIDIYMTAVNSEFYNYKEANVPGSGINQERPEYNNIENGVGHVSSRSQLILTNMRITNETWNAALASINDLNFANYISITPTQSNNVENETFQVKFDM
mgnify:CR=1 FL=1